MSAAPADLPRTPSFSLQGRRSLVTGAGRGIGLAAAAALAEAGSHVTLCSRTENELDAAADALRERGVSVDTMVLDISDAEACERAVRIREPYDVMVNNAGTNRPKPFIDVSIEDFDYVMDINLRGAFFAAQSVSRRMIEAGRGGSIINISSQMGHTGAPNRSVYCASKWGMEGFTRAISIELAKHRIRVNTLCPTFVETPLTRPFFESAEFKSEVLSKIKLGRLSRVEDLMGAIVFLASDASGMMTGSSLIIDGGWNAG